MTQSIPRSVAALAVAATLVFAGCGGNDNPPPTAAQPVEILTLSNRPDLVSAGQVLVELRMPPGADATGLKVDVDGRDVTSAFVSRSGRWMGVVDQLAMGLNTITASADGAAAAVLQVNNSGSGGPVLSGPQVMPFFCATPSPQPATATAPATNSSGLTAVAVDSHCNIPTEYSLWYRTTAGGCSMALPDPSPTASYTDHNPPRTSTPPANPCFKRYDPTASAPIDLATTTTDAGITVPYIVRVERGTINRGIYDIAVLFDPSLPWTAIAPQAQWNGKVIYTMGGSAGQPRRQRRPSSPWNDDMRLSKGYLVAANSLSDNAQNSNAIVSTETIMMTKEHIVSRYGEVRFTIGNGCSGGSLKSHQTASVGPGLFDGLTVSCSYQDFETTLTEMLDCRLLVEAYQTPQWTGRLGAARYDAAQVNAMKGAINGHIDQTGCHGWFHYYSGLTVSGNYLPRDVTPQNMESGLITQLTPPQQCDSIYDPVNNPGGAHCLRNQCEIPNALVYDAISNPQGTKCDPWSYAQSVWGREGSTYDNVGVQYGLHALLQDDISGEEFVLLNEVIGGLAADGKLAASRSTANADALRTAYASGLVANGKQLAKTAIVDARGYDDSMTFVPLGFAGIPLPALQYAGVFGIHQTWRSFSVADRLDRDAGGHANQVMWRFARNGLIASSSMQAEQFALMDQWLVNLKAETSVAPLEQKVVSAKPASGSDYCLLSTDVQQSTRVTDRRVCDDDTYLKPHQSPRQAAGGPRTEDVLKCQLKVIDPLLYGTRLSPSQLMRLATVFPGGVCDWSKPGVAQGTPVQMLTFASSPGGVAVGAAPVSRRR